MLMRTDQFREFDRIAQQLFGTAARPAAMPMDAFRKGDTFYIKLDLPGSTLDAIELTVEQNVLTVHATRPAMNGEVEMLVAERPAGAFTRQVFLGESLDADHIEADYTAGVLALAIPVSEAAKPRKVEITSQDAKQISPA
jgi:HSP20 family protein